MVAVLIPVDQSYSATIVGKIESARPGNVSESPSGGIQKATVACPLAQRFAVLEQTRQLIVDLNVIGARLGSST